MTIRTSHTFHLSARRRERFFEQRYTWTGTGLEKEPTISTGLDSLGHARHRVHGPVLREGINRTLLVDLGRRLDTDEEEIVTIEHTFIDVEGTFQPFLGFTAHEGCQEVDIRVFLPTAYDEAVYGEMCPATSSVPLSRTPLNAEAALRDGLSCNCYRFHITAPIFMTNYRISWRRPDIKSEAQQLWLPK